MDISRRGFLALGGAIGAAGLTAARAPSPSRWDPFTLGVASGDPWPHSVLLWTRLAPYPLERGGGMDGRPHEVAWEVAGDPRMRHVVRAGRAWARPELGHSVHSTVDGLRPGRDYWYRFKAGSWISPIGRTKTAPLPERMVERLDFAAASCQSWSDGYYTAHRHLAAEEVDVVFFLGDYVYEHGIDTASCARAVDLPHDFRTETVSLDRYRLQYALFKSDPDLQAAHHSAPWILTWDDHEVENNYAGELPGDPGAAAGFATRRAAAYQAYWEHLPLRTPRPAGRGLALHRRFTFGSLADFHVLDTRQHRSDQVTGDPWQRDTPQRGDPRRTVLGPAQEAWLADGLATSTATWNVLAQQVVVSHLDIDGGAGERFNADAWDGYPAAQARLYDALARTPNPVVLTGDVHAAYAFDVVPEPGAPPIAVEVAATSISSGGDSEDLAPTGQRFLDANAHLHHVNHRRGYLRGRLTPERITVDFRTVPYVAADAGAPISTDRSFVVRAGQPGLHAVT